jgi:hypothetical protein
MQRLSRNQILEEIEETDMATIHPPANGVSFNREEAGANTWNGPTRQDISEEERNKQLADIRAAAPQNPESYSAKAAQARSGLEARLQAHNDRHREELAAAEKAKGSPLTFEERLLLGKKTPKPRV